MLKYLGTGTNSYAAEFLHRLFQLKNTFFRRIKDQHIRPQAGGILDQILERLTPRRQGKRLLLQVNSDAADSLISNFVAPSLLEVVGTAKRYTCGSNLSWIGKALLIYANDYNDEFPPDLDTLIHKAELPAQNLVCPATELKYIYRGASITTSDTPWLITVYEKAGNHCGGRNVLFLDAHVEWVSEERFQELIKKDNEYRRQKELPILPAQ